MARISNHDHVARTLRTLSILRTETGWHHISRLAEIVGAKPARLGADLRRCCYTADDWHLPLLFGSDMEPEHPEGDDVVQLASDIPITLPLPSSRVEIIRLALLAGVASRNEPQHPRAPVLRALDHRLTAILDSRAIDVGDREPATARAIRTAISNHRQISFTYRSLTDTEAHTRTVVPLRLHRQGQWWLLETHAVGGSSRAHPAATFRVDRIIGEIDDAGHSGDQPGELPTDADGPVPSVEVRLQVHENDLWAVDDLSPTEIEHLDHGRVNVTVHLFAPAAERLSRILFLTNPETTTILSGHTLLDVHRQHVADLVRATTQFPS